MRLKGIKAGCCSAVTSAAFYDVECAVLFSTAKVTGGNGAQRNWRPSAAPCYHSFEYPIRTASEAAGVYGLGHTMIGTVLMLFWGLPERTRSL